MQNHPELIHDIKTILEDAKAEDITIIDVRQLTSITDYMIVCSGRSSRQVKAIADRVVEHFKKKSFSPVHPTGLEVGEWALVDLGDAVVHVMQPDTRAFYNIEALWTK